MSTTTKKPATYSFMRDGHTDSIKVSRNSEAAGSLRYDGATWAFHAHGAVQGAGTVETPIGELRAFAGRPGYIVPCLAKAEGKPFNTLAEAISAVVSTDERAAPVDAQRVANGLLPNFRKYTRFATAN